MNISFKFSGVKEVYRTPFNRETPCTEKVVKLLYPIMIFNHKEFDSSYGYTMHTTEFSFPIEFDMYQDESIFQLTIRFLGFGFCYTNQTGY